VIGQPPDQLVRVLFKDIYFFVRRHNTLK
jgi:hypothetical protein